MSEEQLLLLLTQILVVLGLARLLGEIFRRFGQPPLAGEILAGAILGKTILGRFAPGLFAGLFPSGELELALFDVTAQIGILFLLLVVGLEVDVASAWRMRRQSFGVAVTGVVVPLAAGMGAAWLFFDSWAELPTQRLAFSLFMGAAISITAITVVARLLFDLGIVKSDLGLLLLSAMAINDLLGWVILAVVLGMLASLEPGSLAGPDLPRITMVVLGTLAFAAFCGTLGRSLVTRTLQWFDQQELPSPATPLSFVVCLGLLCGVVTRAIGTHPIFGFLIAGIMAGDRKALSEHTRSIIAQMVEAIFVPLFFAGICLHIDFAAQFNLPMVAAVTALSIFGKLVGAWLGTWLVDLPPVDRLPAAIAHTPGGSMGVLLAVVGREAEIIGPEMFVAIVTASVVSSLLVGPALDWSLHRRDALNVLSFFSRKGVVPNLAAHTRFEAIDELVACAVTVQPSLDAEEVDFAVRLREETMGTGIGHSIAVPHARLEGLRRPLVVFGLSQAGIDWDAVDDHPAHLVFLILTPLDQEDPQLEILAGIAHGLAREESRRALTQSEGAGEIWEVLQRLLRKDAS